MAKMPPDRSYPLSAAFPTRSALAVFRVLFRANVDLGLRGLARLAGISPQTCSDVLAALQRARLVVSQRIGKNLIVRLNENNAIVSELILPLLQRELEMVDEIEGSVRRQFEPLCRKVMMKGVASGTGEVDLIAEPDKIDRLKALADEMAAGLEERYGFDVEFRVFSYDNAPLDLIIG